MQIRIQRIQVRIDGLMLLFPIIAAALGEGGTIAPLFLSLSMHEAAHCLAARALHIPLRSLRLTPFGGMLQIDNPYAIAPLKLCALSVAGPCANLALLFVTAAFCHWQILSLETAAQWMNLNAMLMLFNLLPALPLDGGRALYALLSLRLPRRRAAEIGVFLGRLLSAALVGFSVWGYIGGESINLSPLFAALFVLVSAEDERRALTDSRLHALMRTLRPMDKPERVDLIAIDASETPEAALRAAAPERIALFAVFQAGKFTKIIDSQTLLDRILAANPPKPSSSDNFINGV